MASPTATKALTGRLRFQLDEPNISFDPLMDSGRDWSVPIVWWPRVWLQDLERVSPAEWRGDLWLVMLSPLAVSVEACGGAVSISGRGKDGWRPTSAQSYDGEFYGTHKKRGSYEGLYAAGVYREDCRRLLRRLR
jgi:hypothetical protein